MNSEHKWREEKSELCMAGRSVKLLHVFTLSLSSQAIQQKGINFGNMLSVRKG